MVIEGRKKGRKGRDGKGSKDGKGRTVKVARKRQEGKKEPLSIVVDGVRR